MDDVLALGPAVLVPVIGLLWIGGAATLAVVVGRAIRLADHRSAVGAPR